MIGRPQINQPALGNTIFPHHAFGNYLGQQPGIVDASDGHGVVFRANDFVSVAEASFAFGSHPQFVRYGNNIAAILNRPAADVKLVEVWLLDAKRVRAVACEYPHFGFTV